MERLTDDSTVFVVTVTRDEIDAIKERVPVLGRVCDLFWAFGHVYEREHGQELFDEFKEEVLDHCVYTHEEGPYSGGGTRVQNIWNEKTRDIIKRLKT